MMTPEEIVQQLDRFYDDDVDTRWHAVSCFVGETVPNAVEPLIARLADRDASVRAKAAQALANQYVGDRARMFDALQQVLRDPDAEVRAAAVEAMWRVGLNNRQTFPAVRPLLHDPEAEVRAAAAVAAGHSGDRQALRPLIYLLHDADADVRQAACQGLGSLGLEAAKHALFDVIDTDSEPSVRYKAIEALGYIGRPRSATPTLRELLFEEEDIVSVLIDLITDVESDDSWLRSEAAEALYRIGDKRATGPLIAWACNWQEDDRGTAAFALGYMNDPRAAPYLIALLSDESLYVRFSAILALSNLADARALPELDRLACEGSEEPNPTFGSERIAAAKASAEIREELSWRDFDSLKAYLNGDDEDKREKAVECLAQLADSRVPDLLLKVLTDHNLLAFMHAVGYMANQADARAVPSLIEAAAYWRAEECVGAVEEAENAIEYIQRRLAGEDLGRFVSILDDEDDEADHIASEEDDDLLAGWFNGDSPDPADDD